MAGSLECPRTGLECDFTTYCAVYKDIIEGAVSRLVYPLPEEVREIFRNEFCSEVKVELLTDVVDDGLADEVAEVASLLINGIIDDSEASRTRTFPTPL